MIGTYNKAIVIPFRDLASKRQKQLFHLLITKLNF